MTSPQLLKHLLVAFSLLIVPSLTTKVDYSGHKVIRVIPDTEEQLNLLREWQDWSNLDFWHPPAGIKHPVDIRIAPETYNDVIKALVDMKMTNHRILIEDLGHLQRDERSAIERRKTKFNSKAFDYENYHTFDDILEHLADLANSNDFVSIKGGGITDGGRPIIQMIISGAAMSNKPVIFFDCGIHAREWIAPATCLWIINQLISGYGIDEEITALIDRYDWKFIPVTNPDGYDYSWTSDRMWRKNLVNNAGSNCKGVDINRNFDVGFGGTGSSNLPCSETYHGSGAFSEKESIILRDLIAADHGRVFTAVSIHSFGQLWMSPYSYKLAKPDDYSIMTPVMVAAVDAVRATYGERFQYGNSAQIQYVAGGVTTDHYYDIQGITHSYLIELRDDGKFGFLLPPEYIIASGEEIWNGLKAMVATIEQQQSNK